MEKYTRHCPNSHYVRITMGSVQPYGSIRFCRSQNSVVLVCAFVDLLLGYALAQWAVTAPMMSYFSLIMAYTER